jgi:uncharacterized membrane protein YidH (DUF202 family)
MRVRSALTAFAVFGAAIAWAVQLVAGYGIEEAACSDGTRGSAIWDSGSTPFTLTVTVIAAVAAAAAGAAAWRARRQAERRHNELLAFVGVAGVLASALFLLLILLGGAAAAALDACHP